MKDERSREKETHIYVRVCVYIYRGTKKGALPAREGRKEMEELDQYPTTTGLSVEIRPSVRGPRCTILARYYPSWTREILRARRTGQTEREEETTRLDVAPYRLLSPHIYIYIQVLSQTDLVGCNEWKRSGLLREEESRKFNFDHHGGGIYGRRWSQLG